MNTYFNRPIKTMTHRGYKVEYCLFNEGIHLISVNDCPHSLLNNSIFSHFINVVLNHEGIV
jgi:hypothetical protein